MEQTPGSNTKRRLDYSSRSVRKVLKEYFSEQVGDMYISYVQSQAEGASYRKMYKEIMTY